MKEVDPIYLRRYGTDELPPQSRVLRAGRLSVEFERGNLRYLRFGTVEVLRTVAFLIRDTSWSTYAPVIADLVIAEQESAFQVRYRAHCEGPEGALDYEASIAGDERRLTYSVVGRAEHDFPTNRVGFVVLHPREAAGSEIRVEHTDGSREMVTLPRTISPDQPVFDIRALESEPTPGLSMAVRMEGETFEMEDQRNWSDASFKTYARPLVLPRPFVILAGEPLRQTVRVALEGTAPRREAPAGRVEVPRPGATKGRMPGIGLALDVADTPEGKFARARLQALGIRHVTARWDTRAQASEAWLQRLAEIVAGSGPALTLEIVIPGIDAAGELGSARAKLKAAELSPGAVIASPARDLQSRPSNTSPQGEASASEIAVAARKTFPAAAIGGGMLTYFTELNRNRPDPATIDFITHATSAIVHDADDRSVMETLTTLPDIIRSTRVFAGRLPYRIGASGIGMRENPYGTAVTPNPDAKRLPMARRDPRQRALFGAAFTFGYIAIAAREAIDALTLAHLGGDLGVGEDEAHWWPLAHVLRAAARAASLDVVETIAPPGLAALVFQTTSGPDLWLANLRGETVELEPGSAPFVRMARLDEETVEAASGDLTFMDRASEAIPPMFPLRPYAVLRLTL
jgi:D-apionolactonase